MTILRWNGASWACPAGLPVVDQNLNSVYMVSSTDGWAVGNRTGATTNGWVFLRWNGTSWSQVAVDTSPTIARNLNSVFMLDTNGDGIADDGWAVGQRTGATTNGWVFLRWNGTSWSQVAVDTSPTIAQNLNSVYMVSATEGWAVGNNGVILKWNGSNWSKITSITGADLNELYILGTSVPKGQWREVFQ